MANTKKIPIYCSFGEMADINTLRPNPKNPNQHPAEQVEKLAKIIEAHGWRHPITVSNRSGFIVSGHCRLYAAQSLGVKKVPVDFQDFASASEELAVLVADNRIAELAETDAGRMSDIVRELEADDYSLELAAIDIGELEPVDLTYAEETLRPYQRTNILLSFSPEKLIEIQPLLDEIIKTPGIEYEQSSN
jgi:ParB-like chromosome segregation protein Spo0J